VSTSPAALPNRNAAAMPSMMAPGIPRLVPGAPARTLREP